MGYSNRFVLCILINGVPQKELANGEVHIPFGTTYALRLRNRHNRPAAVQIYIDGENVSGEGYKVPANDKVDIKRYADKDVTFKFVDLESPEAIEHGKNGPNPDKTKGVVEARFYLEREKPKPTKVEHHHHHHPVPQPYPVWPIRIAPYSYNGGVKYLSDGTIDADSYVNAHDSRSGARASGITGQSKSYCDIAKGGTVRDASKTCSLSDTLSQLYVNNYSATISNSSNCSASYSSAPLPSSLREGATVEGHVSGQKFHQVFMDLETDFVSVKLFIKGYDPAQTPTQSVQQPIHENTVPGTPPPTLNTGAVLYCENCGVHRENKMANFCGNCGNKHTLNDRGEVIVGGKVVGYRG